MVTERTAAAGARSDRDSGTALVIRITKLFADCWVLPHQQAARRGVQAAAGDADGRCDRDRSHEAVEPVHHAAMSGNDMARVLDAEPPLDCRLQKVAGLEIGRAHV